MLFRSTDTPDVEWLSRSLPPVSVLGVLWLAGHLEMVDLLRRVVEHLDRTVSSRNARDYLRGSAELGLDRVLVTLVLLAASAGDGVAVGPQLVRARPAVKAKAAARERRCVAPGIARAASALGSAPPQKGQACSSVRT